MFKKTAILGLFLSLLIPVGCAQNNKQADLDDQIEAQLSRQNIKDVDADLKTDGRIELTGNVDTAQQKIQAEQTARNVNGVKAVDNLIRVKNSDTSPIGDDYATKDRPTYPDNDVADNNNTDKDVNKDHRVVPNDSWLTFKTKLALFADTRVSGTDINVETKKGVVNLIGKVPSQEAKAAAVQVAQKIEGVQKVNDQLQVVPNSQHKVIDDTDDNITKNVNNVLDKNALTKDADLNVSSNNGVVSLSGEADNMKQVEVAVNELRKVNGVKAVNADAVVVKNQPTH
jgi:hyperosmotically inducible periplasmic protein